ncbi:MAG: tetratricopeptide repeat protein [Deltaproteobacteria bacterium]|nr:tetratricopeptide repeat protein [Deltaproteobacteria bacterium]
MARRTREEAAPRVWPPWLPAVALAVLTVALFARSLAFPLYGSDDNVYLLEDPRLASPGIASLWQIFTTSFLANYHPVATLTYLVDRLTWGYWLPGYHLTHLAWYVAGVLVVFRLGARLLGDRGWALVAASLYAVHATHVEPVAWLAQRKDLVCLVFFTGALVAYDVYARRAEARAGAYVGALLLTVLAVFSKGYAVVLPGLFVAYDLCFAPAGGWRRIADKVPFVLVAAVATLTTLWAQEKDAALMAAESLGVGPGERALALAKVFAVYVGHTLMPVGLSAEYAVGPDWQSVGVAGLGVASSVLLVFGFVRLRRRLPAVAFGIAVFLLPLLTVMNVFWTLASWMNDRYLFLPTVGSSLALAAGGRWLATRGAGGASAWTGSWRAGAAAVVALNACLTVLRLGDWRDELHVRSDVVRKQLGLRDERIVTAAQLGRERVRTVPGFKALLNLRDAHRHAGNLDEAAALSAWLPATGARTDAVLANDTARRDIAAGRYDAARAQLESLAAADTWNGTEAQELLGLALEKQGRIDEAHASYEKALARQRRVGRAGISLLLKLGELALAGRQLEEAERWAAAANDAAPAEDGRPLFLRGRLAQARGRLAEAYDLCVQALARSQTAGPGQQIAPADLLATMAWISDAQGERARALGELQRALAATADDAQAAALHLKAGLIAGALDRPGDAGAHLGRVLELAPAHPEKANILVQLANAREASGDKGGAAAALREVLTVAPQHPERVNVMLKLGQLADGLGDVPAAIAAYEGALRVAPEHPSRAAVEARIAALRTARAPAGR